MKKKRKDRFAILIEENKALKDKIQRAKNCLVCCPIANPTEVCVNTLEILSEE
jgi:hypothetical protein